jgi:predicted metal-dependent hydrolase
MRLDYEIVYSNRKTINISVDRDKKILVKAPRNISDDKIEKIIKSKGLWIFDKLKRRRNSEIINTYKEFVSGESLLFLGSNYQLNVLEEKFRGIKFEDKFYISNSNRHKAKTIFKKWYIDRAKEIFYPKIEHYAKSLGVEIKNVVIKQMKMSWGSCAPNGTITLNWKLIKAPSYVINYIIVHELAHLIELNHTPKFWNVVTVQVPNYKKAKKWLRDNGYLLEIDF